MKLRLDEYYYLINDDIDDLEKYMPEDKLELVTNYKKEHPDYLNEDDFWNLLHSFYSYINVLNSKYDILYIDLECSLVKYQAIISINNKYCSFEYYDSLGLNFEDCVDANEDLVEVEPIEVKITKYINKNEIN